MCDFHQFQTDESQRLKWIALFDRNLHRITNRKQMDSFSLLRHRFTGGVLSITFIGMEEFQNYTTHDQQFQKCLDFRHKKPLGLSMPFFVMPIPLTDVFSKKPKHWGFWMKMFHCKHASWLQCFLTPIIAETYRCFSFSRACFSGFQPLVLGGVTLPSEVGWVKRKRWNFERSYRLDFFTGQPVSAEIFRQT